MDTFEVNTGKPYPLASGIKTTRKRGSGGVWLTDYVNYMWYGAITIGTPPQDFTGMTLSYSLRLLSDAMMRPMPCHTVDFDTGSSDLFVPSPKCGDTCQGHNVYYPSASWTSRDLDKTFTLEYGGGGIVQGEQYTDVVTIAGLTVRVPMFFLFFL